MLIGPAVVTDALLALQHFLACLEGREEVLGSESGGKHPIRPAGEGAELTIDGCCRETVGVKPVRECVDVIRGRTGSESLPRNG
jgi:hypothetical protein